MADLILPAGHCASCYDLLLSPESASESWGDFGGSGELERGHTSFLVLHSLDCPDAIAFFIRVSFRVVNSGQHLATHLESHEY